MKVGSKSNSELAPADKVEALPCSELIDIRIQYFLYLLPLGALFHAVDWITRRGGLQYTKLTATHSWSPGFFLSVEADIFFNWFLWFGLILYLPFGKYKRATAIIISLLTISHFFHLPVRVSNHFIVLAISIILLGLCRHKNGTSTPLIVPLLRCLVVFTYIFAVIHKLNPVYFSSNSPAHRIYSSFFTNLGFSDLGPLLLVLPSIGLACEILIPILLVVKKWRPYGFYLGIIFHGSIAAMGAADYSAVILMLYPVFLERDEARRVAELIRNLNKRRLLVAALIGFAVTFACYFPVDFSNIKTSNNGQPKETFFFVLILVTFYIYTAMALLPWFFGKIKMDSPEKQVLSRSAQLAILSFIILYTINCMGPYLGLKFYYSQNMFSGLNRQGSNHFLIPRLKIFDYERYVDVELFETKQLSPKKMESDYRPFIWIANKAKTHYVATNLLASTVEHACKHAELRPIKLSYVTKDRFRKRHSFNDACTASTGLGPSYPFNFYPHFVKGRSKPLTSIP